VTIHDDGGESIQSSASHGITSNARSNAGIDSGCSPMKVPVSGQGESRLGGDIGTVRYAVMGNIGAAGRRYLLRSTWDSWNKLDDVIISSS